MSFCFRYRSKVQYSMLCSTRMRKKILDVMQVEILKKASKTEVTGTKLNSYFAVSAMKSVCLKYLSRGYLTAGRVRLKGGEAFSFVYMFRILVPFFHV